MAERRQPMTLAEVRIKLQEAIDTKNEELSTKYLELLKKLGVTVNYIQETEEDMKDRNENTVKEYFLKNGMTKFDINTIMRSNPLHPNETPNSYIERLSQVPQVRSKMNPK